MSGADREHPSGRGPGGDERARTGADRLALRPGSVTSMGSLPHRDADEAAAFVLAHHPGLPAAPQLPSRSPLENMVAQAARGIPGVHVSGEGVVSLTGAGLDVDAPVRTPVDGASHGGLLAFLAAVAGRTEPVKIQLTGPITLGLALEAAGADAATAFAVAGAAVSTQARDLATLTRHRLPESPLLVVLDEPGLVALPTAGIPLAADAVIDLLSGALATLEATGATTGVHCCGRTDWRLVSQAGPTLLAFPVEADVASTTPAPSPATSSAAAGSPGARCPPTGRSGPTRPPVAPPHRPLVRAGPWRVRPGALRTQAVITPACGLAGHGISQAARCLELAADLARRVVDQSMAAKLSMGA
jgi:hypothetical protein